MKALTLRQVNAALVFEDRAEPHAAAGEILVRLKAAALNRRDFWITRGKYPGVTTPVVLGSDGAGVVSAVGDGVDASWLGREVVINPGLDWGDSEAAQSDRFSILGMPRDGTFATHVAVPAAQMHPKPQHLDWREAAALPLAGVTAYRALFSQGGLQRGENVLVTGIGGGVATFVLQFAVAAGASVWVTSSSPEKIERAVGCGARGGFDYRDEHWAQACAGGAGPLDLAVDGAGGAGYASLVHLAAAGGRIVNYGATAGSPPQLDLFKVFWKQLRLQGSTMGSPRDFAAMLAFVEEHRIKPIVDGVIPLADGQRAIERMATSPQFGKFVLDVE